MAMFQYQYDGDPQLQPIIEKDSIKKQLKTPNVYKRLMIAVCASIVTTFFNTTSYNGIISSLNLFLQNELSQSKANASINMTLFSGASYFMAIISAIIADSFLGRFKTILISLIIYLLATSGVAIIAFTLETGNGNLTTTKQILFYIALYLIAFSYAGIGPNNSSLGAEQFEYHASRDYKSPAYKYQTSQPQHKMNKLSKYKESFFQWRYFTRNAAALFAFSVIAYLAQDVSFGIFFIVIATCIFCGLFIFTVLSRFLYNFKPQGNTLLKSIKILFYILFSKINKQRSAQQLAKCNITEIKHVNNVMSMFPFWICYTIYFMATSTQFTVIYIQGCQMNYVIEWLGFNIPIAAMVCAQIIVILILIPLFDRCLFPLLRTKYNFKVTMLQKIGTGFIFAILSMICFGFIEIYRKHSTIKVDQLSVCHSSGNDNIYISNLSIFWQVPAFMLWGIGEAFTRVTGPEFFFNEVPQSMKSVMSAIFTMSRGFGSMINGLAIIVAKKWITNDLNKGNLDLYFFCIAAILFAAFTFFVFSAKRYQYNNYCNDQWSKKTYHIISNSKSLYSIYTFNDTTINQSIQSKSNELSKLDVLTKPIPDK